MNETERFQAEVAGNIAGLKADTDVQAQITRQVAIVQYPVMSSAIIRHVDIVQLTPERGLVIMVNSSGRVDQRQVELGGAQPDDLSDLRVRVAAAAESSSNVASDASQPRQASVML